MMVFLPKFYVEAIAIPIEGANGNGVRGDVSDENLKTFPLPHLNAVILDGGFHRCLAL
jgi:hypothetical protein